MKKKQNTKAPPISPRTLSYFSFVNPPGCTFIEYLFKETNSYLKAKKDDPLLSLETFFDDDLLHQAREGNLSNSVKAMRQIKNLVPGALYEDEIIKARYVQLEAEGNKFYLNELNKLNKRERHKYAFSLTHLQHFSLVYGEIVFLRKLYDLLNAEADAQTWALQKILSGLALVETANKHRPWIDAIFSDKYPNAIERASFIYGDITGWKSIHKYVFRFLKWKSIQPEKHNRAVGEAHATADAWLRKK